VCNSCVNILLVGIDRIKWVETFSVPGLPAIRLHPPIAQQLTRPIPAAFHKYWLGGAVRLAALFLPCSWFIQTLETLRDAPLAALNVSLNTLELPGFRNTPADAFPRPPV
jgi:hypothetical protein